MDQTNVTDILHADRSCWTVFLIFLRLGLTSFGGPIAQLGYFRDVVRRQWLSERSYADVVYSG
ncbi:chromate transporter [Pseudomonas soli]|uniref:chromate transporter n=1 Tax=Pseudomonas soli TaxID=1306993 RepID=UPI003D07B090